MVRTPSISSASMLRRVTSGRSSRLSRREELGKDQGFARTCDRGQATKARSKESSTKTPKKKEKMRTKRLVIVSLGVLLFLSLIGLSIVGLANYLLSEDDEQTESAKADAFVLTPDQDCGHIRRGYLQGRSAFSASVIRRRFIDQSIRYRYPRNEGYER